MRTRNKRAIPTTVLGLNVGVTGCGKRLRDGAVALIENGEVRYACAEERFTRRKHDGGFQTALDACFREVDVRLDEIDLVAVSSCCEPVCRPGDVLKRYEQLPFNRVEVVPHHLSHAFSSFCVSPFEEAIVIVMDAGGNMLDAGGPNTTKEWWAHSREQFTSYRGEGKEVNRLERDFAAPYEAGLGEVYRAFTYYLGWPSYTHSANTMALAAFGNAEVFNELELFGCCHGKLYSRVRNDPHDPISMVARLASNQNVKIPPPREDFPEVDPAQLPDSYCHLAARLQDQLEEALIKKVRYLVKKTGLSKLCIAGGVGLNCVANRKLLDEAPIDNIFIQPAAGDDGQALGNALFGYHSQLNERRKQRTETFSPYLGISYDLSHRNIRNRKSFTRAANDHNIQLTQVADIEDRVAMMLKEGQVIGWFQGRSEYGPRALGNRSILADPRSSSMASKCHSVKKHHEPYRPFAPSVLAERASDYFKIQRESPYMILVAEVRSDKESVIPAVVHVDKTSRLQTVRAIDNPKFHRLLRRFEERTGVPLLLNTSFNRGGEPIVESPDDALQAFLDMNLDALIIGDTLVQKRQSRIMIEARKYATSQA